MYTPDHFAIHQREALHQIIQTHPLGALVTLTPDGLDANHIPFQLDTERQVLTAHVARANPVWRAGDGAQVLVIFRAEEGYISPNWYPSKAETHRLVPTWNYQVVHVHGRLTVQDQETFVRGVVGRLTRTHEAAEAKPWKMSDAPPDFIRAMLQAIVGIEVTMDRLEGKAKLSQNRDDRDRLHAADEVLRRGYAELAQAMRTAR